jgi:preprotein translocase subunit YajC
MSATPASGAAAEGGLLPLLVNFAPFIVIFILFYFLLIRPQQNRAKAHAAQVAGIKRGDTVVLSNGMIGKVTRVEDQEAMVEISQGVNVRVLKNMVAEVRGKGEIAAANDKS